jgi:ribonuclease HI
MIKQAPTADPTKGKTVVSIDHLQPKGRKKDVAGNKQKATKRWSKPPPGWTKLNVDGSWEEGERRGGFVLRDEEGGIIFAVCRHLSSCDGPLEAEIMAFTEGLALALERTDCPIIIENDCQEATAMINDASVNRSPVAALINEAKYLCKLGRECQVRHISRELNSVSHILARWGCTRQCTQVWPHSGLDFIMRACNQDLSSVP